MERQRKMVEKMSFTTIFNIWRCGEVAAMEIKGYLCGMEKELYNPQLQWELNKHQLLEDIIKEQERANRLSRWLLVVVLLNSVSLLLIFLFI